MHVIEQYLQGKLDDLSLCEDLLVTCEAFSCVIDGATSKTNYRISGKTTGRIAAEVIADAVNKLDPQVEAHAAVEALSEAVRNISRIGESSSPEVLPLFTASIAIFSHQRQEVWLVGDCQCLVGDVVTTQRKRIDQVLGDMRATYLEFELLSGKSVEELMVNDTGRQFIHPLLEKQVAFQNAKEKTPLSYGAIDGKEVPDRFVKIVSTQASSQVILATDGYPIIRPTLWESETELAWLIKMDPLCMREYRSTKGLMAGRKAFDDRAYLRIST